MLTPLELPRSVLGVLLEFVDHASLHQLEATCRHARATIDATGASQSVLCLCFHHVQGTHTSQLMLAGIWRSTALKRMALRVRCTDNNSSDDAIDWKRMACIATMPCERDRNLLHDVYGTSCTLLVVCSVYARAMAHCDVLVCHAACSSVDRPCESPANTLEPSRCWLSMQSLSDRAISLQLQHTSFADSHSHSSSSARQSFAEVAQIECGCETTPCYWSSSPSPSKASRDFIEYTTRAACVIAAVHVLPYRAFWHPDSPTFAPQSVSFEFFAHDARAAAAASDQSYAIRDCDASDASARVCVYASPVYTMYNDMQLHAFELPKRVWFAEGGTFRLNLIGRYQQETFEMPPWIPSDEQEPAEPPYYCCLSYVSALGVSIDDR